MLPEEPIVLPRASRQSLVLVVISNHMLVTVLGMWFHTHTSCCVTGCHATGYCCQQLAKEGKAGCDEDSEPSEPSSAPCLVCQLRAQRAAESHRPPTNTSQWSARFRPTLSVLHPSTKAGHRYWCRAPPALS